VHHLLLRFGIFSVIREKTTSIGTRACKIQITDKHQVQRFAQRIGFSPGCVKQQRLETQVLPMIQAQPRRRSNFDTLPVEAWAIVGAAARVGGVSLNSIGVARSDQSVSISSAKRAAFRTGDLYLNPLIEGPLWDAVETIEPAGTEEVFDISVPNLHNFVANDLIVHNSTYARCGIIVNVTPLEPEWEGHVTLEFSNTTPLPAKIYANEGVAQMLFFESDEVCETSYADRGGKYQKQRGVTLPKA
jgi:LAGLIDADG-like domain